MTRMLPDGAWHLWAALAASRRTDVFLSTNSYLTAWFTRVPTGVLVYDLIAFLPGTAPQRRAALIERATIERAVRRAKVLICISEATRRDLEERFPTAAGRTVVTPLAAAQRFAAAEGDARPNGSVLCVGTLEPRKNLVRAIDAYERLPPGASRPAPPRHRGSEGLGRRRHPPASRDRRRQGRHGPGRP